MNEDWDVRTAGPADAGHRVLLIPGAMCTTEFYADVMAEPRLPEAGVRTVAATMPGFGRTRAPADTSPDGYARLFGRFAADQGCDVVAGHSLGANVALEMAAAGTFTGPVVLLSPTFSRKDESTTLALLDAVGRVPVLGPLVWAGATKAMAEGVKRILPPARAAALSASMRTNRSPACRRIIRDYYAYLDRHSSLVTRLCDSGVPAWVVRGDRDEVGLTASERRGLEDCPHVSLVDVPDAGHFALVEHPARVADVLVEAVAALRTG
jgi:pimeloyl-ACP methyl ester carboxylesterase